MGKTTESDPVLRPLMTPGRAKRPKRDPLRSPYIVRSGETPKTGLPKIP